MRVLVCDDNTDAAETLSMLLRSEGHEVIVSHDGRECVARAVKWKPKVAFLDISMPHVSGYAVARQLRQSELGSDVLLVAVTACDSDDDRDLALLAGFDIHIVKPAKPAAILAIAANPVRPSRQSES